MSSMPAMPPRNVAGLLFTALALAGTPAHRIPGARAAVNVKLSEWKVELSQTSITAGPVTFTVTNTGNIPHAFEVEGQGIEQETTVIQPGSSATLTLTLKPGTYEAYCPVGNDSHRKLGMQADLKVARATDAAPPPYDAAATREAAPKVQAIRVIGGGTVIQILPGPFPFPDSAAPILKQFGDEREGLESQVKNGPYSNNVTPISGTFTFTAWDKGAVRDSVDGVAEFTTHDGARWKVVLDRVQTKDVPHHPKFGGVILGLYYHGATAVHTPLVPTINSAVALWAFGHLYKNDTLVTDNAMVHVMLLSRTRREGDFALACWTAPGTGSKSCSSKSSPAQASPSSTHPAGSCLSTGKSPAPAGRRAEEETRLGALTQGSSLTSPLLRLGRGRLGRVDELVIVAHSQADGRLGVEDDGRITVQLDGTRGHHAGDRSLDGLGDRLGLSLPARHQHQVPRIEDRPDAHRDRIDGHHLTVLEEPGVVVDRLFGQRLEPRARAERAPRLVERDVAVGADAQDLQIDAAAFRDAPLVPLAEGGIIAGRARRDVDVVRGNVHVLEEVLVHEVVIALGVIRGQPDVFVEVERRHAREVHLPRLMQPHQLLIEAEWRRSGRHAEHGVRLGVEHVDDDLRRRLAHLLVVSLDDDFHGASPPYGPAEYPVRSTRIRYRLFPAVMNSVCASGPPLRPNFTFVGLSGVGM